MFGQWNALVVIGSDGRVTGMVNGHGGEIIPGRLDDHIDALRHYAATGERRPVQLDIDITMACASACTFCFSADYRATRKKGLSMRRDLVTDLIRGWAEQGVRVVRFDGGGDPLLHGGLIAAINEASHRGIRTAVLTAGDMLSDTHVEPFVAARTYLRVSMNAGSDTMRLLVHRPANRRYTLDGPLAAVRKVANARAAEYGEMGPVLMPLGATSMLVPANAGDTFAIARAAREAGFDHLSYRVVLGARHAVTFTPTERECLHEQLERVRRELVDESFRIFVPSRDLTDEGYRPSRYFDTCLACTQRALVEVGPSSDEAALVPCGRYRGHGFQWNEERTDLTVFGLLRSGNEIGEVLASPHMVRLVDSFPSACEDCIDRSANVMFNGIVEAFRNDPGSTFVRYWRDDLSWPEAYDSVLSR